MIVKAYGSELISTYLITLNNHKILLDFNCDNIAKEDVGEVELPPIKSKALTMLDEDYPEEFKHYPYPPIVLFYYGDISLLKDFSKKKTTLDYNLKMTIWHQ